VLAWSPDVRGVEFTRDGATVQLSNGERHLHRRDAAGWHVELFAAGARSGVDLSGWRPAPERRQATVAAPSPPVVVRRASLPDTWYTELSQAQRARLVTYELGEKHYRRSEDNWSLAGSPRATIALGADAAHLLMYAHVRAGERHFARADALNPLDNEHADTMGAGLQLYLRTPDAGGAWMLIPDADGSAVRTRAIAGWGSLPTPRVQWRATADGYELRARIPLPTPNLTEYPVDVDVIVNETTAERTRRRGQLVMSGAAGEFVYLRGDRHDPARLIPLVLVS